ENGRSFPADLSAPRVPPARHASRALAREIGRRRRLEAELELARRDLEVFAYSVAHDLRTPLQAMSGFAQLLLEERPPDLGPSNELLERIAHASLRMQAVLDRMLQFARPPGAELERSVVDVGALARDVAERIQEREASRQVEWVIES